MICLMNVANQLGGSRDFMPLELRIGVFDTTIQHVAFKIDDVVIKILFVVIKMYVLQSRVLSVSGIS